jgi:uncharacterized protein (DUF433 family)
LAALYDNFIITNLLLRTNHMLTMDQELLARVVIDPEVFGGKPFIRGTGISIAIILDALALGLTPDQIIDHYPSLEVEDVHAALAFATRLAEMNGGVAMVGPRYSETYFLQR